MPMVWKLDLLKHPEGALCLGFGAGWRRTILSRGLLPSRFMVLILPPAGTPQGQL